MTATFPTTHCRSSFIRARSTLRPRIRRVAFEALFRRHGWGGSWRNGIFPFHHYHSTAHEVLGIAAGEAEVRFGGENGETLTVRAGDAVLIPAGVGHKRLSATPDLLVIGAYPGGQRADLMREGAEDKDGIRRRVAAAACRAPTRSRVRAGRWRSIGRPSVASADILVFRPEAAKLGHHVGEARRLAVDEGEGPADLDRRRSRPAR